MARYRDQRNTMEHDQKVLGVNPVLRVRIHKKLRIQGNGLYTNHYQIKINFCSQNTQISNVN